MKNKIFARIGAVVLSLCMLVSLMAVGAFAATVEDATIDTEAECSLTLYKIDFTNAQKDGVWDDSYITTGQHDQNVEDILINNANRTGDIEGDGVSQLENGQTSNGYAIKGVEFSYMKVADIVTFTESANDQHPDYNLTQVLYGFDKVAANELLTALGLGDGNGRYENADATDKLNDANWYYDSDTLNAALKNALATDNTATKNAIEDYIDANHGADASVGGTMPLTDSNGRTSVSGLEVGLYIVVETKVPEMVVSTTAPFFLSLPMTTVDGGHGMTGEANVTTGGHDWLYDIVLYPKNETGIVTLEKTLRESKPDTGKNNGSTNDITDGYAHTGTASAGDIIDYQVISTLPMITSEATNISVYTFNDTLSAGLTYTKGDVLLEWFTDKACTNKVASWDEASGKFTVAYGTRDDKSTMTIAMTDTGLAEINARAKTAGNVNGVDYAGYSNYTVRVTYTAKVDSDASFIYGDEGNENTVTLTWCRTSSEYYDILVDDAHVYSYGLDLTKLFKDTDSEAAADAGKFDHVKFKIQNATDGYFVQAALNADEGVYYVTGHTTEEAEGTEFIPVTVYPDTENLGYGRIVVKGLEDDEYIVTEIETANGYTLLKDDVHFTITAEEDDTRPCSVYADEAKLGVYQNDGHYYFDGCPDLPLSNIPQVQLAHDLLTAHAIVDTNAVTMLNDTDPTTGEDRTSTNALVPMTIVNTQGFDLPQTGERTTLYITIIGTLMVFAAATVIGVVLFKKKEEEAQSR